ncbi:MAG: hypothetical protein ACFCAD_26285 [Pleurocapsa sp.]
MRFLYGDRLFDSRFGHFKNGNTTRKIIHNQQSSNVQFDKYRGRIMSRIITTISSLSDLYSQLLEL